MSGEAIWHPHPGGLITLEGNGGSITVGSVVEANDAYLSNSNVGLYPLCDFALSVTFGTAPTAGRLLELRARPMNIDGTNDAELMDILLGVFAVNNVTTTQYLPLFDVHLPLGVLSDELRLGLFNGANQTVSSGWTLKGYPKSINAAP